MAQTPNRRTTLSFTGEIPCDAQGKPINHLVHNPNPQTLFDKFVVKCQFSNKPSDVPTFPNDYYEKMVHYIELLVAHARVIDPNVDARTGKAFACREEDSVFRYPDSASPRAGILAVSQKLAMARVAIIGLGGTGGYIFDQVAKTYVKEIHLFDGDIMKRHNAFRAPGAASLQDLNRQLKKVDYFREKYEPMRSGIVTHPYFLDQSNVEELKGFDFAFVAVDDGLSRGLICEYLQQARIPFVDVGMGLEKSEGASRLLGICRVTAGTFAKQDHLRARLPTMDDRADALYRTNIQVADMNAMNAILAVMKWKQICDFYVDYDQAHELSFSVAMQSIVRADTVVSALT
jgi:tRNA A37 threonylcarbamoyladenosine dehydratase